jgi:putative phosphoesterase
MVLALSSLLAQLRRFATRMVGALGAAIMRVAALYDIHGNLPALDAVLEDAQRERVDVIVVGGDVVPGPMPRETITRLLALERPVRFIRGNGDRVVAVQAGGGHIGEVSGAFRDVIRWCAEQLDPEHHRQLASWPPSFQVAVDGLGEVLFCHATPRNDLEILTRLTPDDVVARMLLGVNARTVVCGHTHLQFDRTVGNARVINAGSVGMPFAGPQGAYWLVLGPDVQLRRTAYDFDGAAEQIRATAYPQVEALALRYILSPPSEEESLAMFSAAEAT